MRRKITISGPKGPIRSFVLEDLNEATVSDLGTVLGLSRWLAQAFEEDPWVLRDCAKWAIPRLSFQFTIDAVVETLDDHKEE